MNIVMDLMPMTLDTYLYQNKMSLIQIKTVLY